VGRRPRRGAWAAGLLWLLAAGCSGAGAPPLLAVTPEADSLAATLQVIAPNQRLEWSDLETACAGRPGCRAELASFRERLATGCPDSAACPPDVVRLPALRRSGEQRAAGLYPAELPTAARVLETWRRLAGSPSP
jgi:hypothetical protein